MTQRFSCLDVAASKQTESTGDLSMLELRFEIVTWDYYKNYNFLICKFCKLTKNSHIIGIVSFWQN